MVSEIGTALGDDARHSRFVRTVHNVGYAFSGAAVDVGRVVQASVPSTTYMLMWESRQFPLAREGEHVIGRDLDIAVTLESTTVSRRHARLRVTTSAVTIEDLDSKNGTFLNDVRVAGEMNVADGDRIRVGSLLNNVPPRGALQLHGDRARRRETRPSPAECLIRPSGTRSVRVLPSERRFGSALIPIGSSESARAPS